MLLTVLRHNKYDPVKIKLMEWVLTKNNTIDFDWDLKCLQQPKKEYGELIKMFDKYNLDGKSSLRIINFLKQI